MSIYYQDDKVVLHHGDCLDVLATLPDASVDAVVCDPPYGLANTDPAHVAETITRWVNGERDYLPGGRGFMGKEWDAFVPPVAVWDECLRVLKPGGHVLAFAGSRTVDLMTLGLRLAGFDIRDSLAWLYGSGWPKSMDVSKAIDKLDATDERTRRARAFQSWLRQHLTPQDVNRLTGTDMGHHLTTHPTQPAVATAELFDLLRSELPKVPQHIEDLVSERTVESQNFAARLVTGKHSAGTHRGVSGFTVAGEGKERRDFAHTPEAREWQGWGTALKPGHEPVVCARKPFNAVPLGEEVDHLHHLIGGLLWLSLSPAKRAELTSQSSPAGPHGVLCVSALVSAALNTSPEESGETATYNSPALASTSLSIASSWSATLDALSTRTKTSTTSTASSTTIGLRTLSSLLGPLTSQTTMPECGCLLGGQTSPAPSVESPSSDEWASWLHTLSASVPETATEGIALAVASALASIADELSADQEGASSVGQTATTGVDERRSSLEPIVMARKPLTGTIASNVLEHGTGALNIDACRVATSDSLGGGRISTRSDGWDRPWKHNPEAIAAAHERGAASVAKAEALGRWPANVILDESQAEALDEQSGERPGMARGKLKRGATTGRSIGGASAYGTAAPHEAVTGYGDSGGASRFFYVAKAPKSERPVVDGVAHPTVKPVSLMSWLVRLVTPPGGTVLEPFAGSGTTVEAAMREGFNVVAVEREADYLPLIMARIERENARQSAEAANRVPTLFDEELGGEHV